MARRIEFYERTNDNGYKMRCWANNNNAEYILTSARAHDLMNDFREKYGRMPHSSWFHRHFSFERYTYNN